ncbi:MAG: 3-deoxy-manno-octulosonate cytidylyltransferase, partial [Acidobacteria bacterium]|nr:3-deoxy-manno-octulosonate cytidylyltransferase [Acidobacteriota bacterium]
GDEPLIEPYTLERLVELFERDKDIKMATLASPILNEEEMRNPNVVKVVMDKDNFSLYFSRSPIPYLREVKFKDSTCFKHIGIYGFKKDFLLDFASTPRGILEESESLEQLRALENGIRIKVGLIEKWNGVSVDNPEDIAKVENEIKKGGITPP